DTMRKRLLLIGLVVVGIALLSGCAVIDHILGLISGGVGTTSSVYPISGRMGFTLAATVWQNNGYTPISSSAGEVATTFWSGVGKPGGCFNAYSWDGEDFSNTMFYTCLSQDEKTIVSFVATQTQANVWFGYTYVHVIEGGNVPFSHVDGNSRFYVASGTSVRTLVTAVEFKMWAPGAGGSASNPQEWIAGGPAALTGGADDAISIRLDYENAAVAP
ncbi:hypothetical protein KAR02_05890, partial [Candidatus Bipolaricaulota bacterium]|nr:hypothetical protein [Candidatus Bipolaricaulota bacterium]